MAMARRTFLVACCMLVGAGIVSARLGQHPTATTAPGRSLGANVAVVATGFNWAENVRCDAETEALFVSEYKRGELYKITSSAPGVYNQTIHASTGYDLFAGLAIHDATGTLYAIARESGSGDCYIITVDKVTPETTTKVAKLPKLGNGLAINQATGHLYATAEGGFIPLEGAMYEIEPSTGTVTERISYSFADDGAYVNQNTGVLFLSEVIGSEVLHYDLNTQDLLGKDRAPSGVGMLDDFCLSADGHTLYGADYQHGNVVSFPADGRTGSTATILLSKLSNPTSARWGCGGGFPTTSLIVTEGGSLLGNPADRLVLQLFDVRSEADVTAWGA